MKTAILLLIIVAPTIGLAQPKGAVEARALLARFAKEPNVNQVQGAAIQYARMSPERFDAMVSRSRGSAVLPNLRLRVIKRLEDESIATTDFEGSVPTDLTGRRSEDDRLWLEAQATWQLSDLVFSSREISIAKENRYVAKDRQKLIQLVTQLYFERRRAQIELIKAPPTDVTARALTEMKIQQLTAELDGITGGAFSRMVSGKTH